MPPDAPSSPLAWLCHALAGAVERRDTAGWAHQDRAKAALAAARRSLGQDAPAGSVEAAPGAAFAHAVTDLSRHAGLEALETTLLLAALGPELDSNVHLLTGLLSGDDAPQRPTVALGLELAGRPQMDTLGREALAELAALRRHSLLHLDGPGVLLARRMVVADRVTAQLLGDTMPSAHALTLISDPAPVDLPGAEQVAAALHQGHTLAWVHSPPGAAGTALAAAACRMVGAPCLQADLQRLPRDIDNAPPSRDQVTDAVQSLLLEATLGGCVLILAGAELAGTQMDRLARAALPVIAVGTTPWDPAWPVSRLPVSVIAPRVTTAIRSALWQPVLAPGADLVDIAALRLTPGDIVRVRQAALDHASVTRSADDATMLTTDDIKTAARRLGRNRSSKFQASTEPASLDDLVLPEHTKSEVARLLDWARYRDEVLSQGPLQGKGGKGTGICALFAGGPGTGKSLAAHVVSDTLGMDLYTVDISSLVDKYIGETEKNLERVFTEAESLNAVLFFDEADSIFGSRSEVKDAHDRYANQEVAYLLQRMEQFDGITVLATNLRGNLDPAFSRRLHFVIHFPDPDEETRARLWWHHLAGLAATDPADPVDVGMLASSLNIAGGEVRNIVLSAAYAATAEGVSVGMRHVSAAAAREYTKLGRRIPGEFPSNRTPPRVDKASTS